MLKPLLLIFSIFGFLSLDAQLFTVSTAVEDSLTQGEQDFRQRMLDSAYYLSSQSVEIADFQTLLSGDSVTFTLPGMTGNFKAKKVLEYNETNYHYDFLWAGNLENEFPGQMMIVQKGNMFGGFIQTKDNFFTIFPTGNNRGLLMKNNPLKDAELQCGLEPEAGPETQVDPCLNAYNTCSARIHALLLITPEQREFLAGLQLHTFVQNIYYISAMEVINIAFANSDIPNKRVYYSIVNYDDFTLSPSIFQAIDDLVADLDIKQLRNAFKADVVVMLTGIANVGAAGITPGDSFENPNLAYAVVRGPNAYYPTWTIAHEMTHLMRAGHISSFTCFNCNIFLGDDDPDCSHGWRLEQSPASAMTLHGIGRMDQGDYRIFHFSNPDVNYNGLPTGSAGDPNATFPYPSDNARTIRNGACVVADYRPSPFLDVFLSVPGVVCEEDGLFNASALVTEALAQLPGHPPYTYS